MHDYYVVIYLTFIEHNFILILSTTQPKNMIFREKEKTSQKPVYKNKLKN
jgi:hypothetical protein